MRELGFLITAVLGSFCGMAWLALGMSVHWKAVWGAASSPAQPPGFVLRFLGSASLVASLAFCLAADHPSIAVLVWIMSLAAGALTVAFMLTWRAHWLAWLVPWVRARA